MITRRGWLVSALSTLSGLALCGKFASARTASEQLVHPSTPGYDHGMENKDVTDQILRTERAAMDRWAKGDPDGFLEITAPDVSYFDPFLEKRLDGLEAITAYYNSFRGKVHIDHYELINPRVQCYGDMAILTYQFDSKGSEGTMHWNTTETYRRSDANWKLVHIHWAFHQPKLASPAA